MRALLRELVCRSCALVTVGRLIYWFRYSLGWAWLVVTTLSPSRIECFPVCGPWLGHRDAYTVKRPGSEDHDFESQCRQHFSTHEMSILYNLAWEIARIRARCTEANLSRVRVADVPGSHEVKKIW